jgi:recombination protein RecR
VSLFPPSLERLVLILARLPGIGRKSATRIALKLVASSDADCRELARAIVDASEKTVGCSICGALTEADPCDICTDSRRDPAAICVVERPSDVIALERTSRFRGRYHVLDGLLSPLDGVGPEDLRLDSLVERAHRDEVSEIILALNPTAEGEATSLYLARLLADHGVRVTKLASGIPVGGDLDLADELTLGTALEERREL